MAIIALANLKGGVGKSTLAVNIAGALAPKSVLVDADPQATATAWGKVERMEKLRTRLRQEKPPQARRSASEIVREAMEAHRPKVEAELRKLRERK